MKPDIRDRLVPFYFGAIQDEERLSLERALLTETDILVDYLDLKREIEGAGLVPAGPSPALLRRLSERLARMPRRRIIAVSLGLAAAASIAVCLFALSRPAPGSARGASKDGVLFDPGRELSDQGGVL